MYERIRALREDRDLSQKQLSQALHCSQQVYSNYELGQRDIPTAILLRWRIFTAPAQTISWAARMKNSGRTTKKAAPAVAAYGGRGFFQ